MNQRKQKRENITGIRPETKETKSQRKQRKRLELERSQQSSKQRETQRKAHERAQKKNPKKERKQAKRRHRASKKEARRKQRQPELLSSALEKNVQRWFLSGKGYKLPNVFLNDTEDRVKKLVNTVLIVPKKVYTILKCILVKHDLLVKKSTLISLEEVKIMTKLGDTYEEMKGKMLESLSKFQKEGSGWQLHSIVGLYIVVVKFKPLSGSGYSKLPPFITKKKQLLI